MSDLISRSALLKCFCVTKEGRRIPEFDCDNKEVTVSIKDVKRVIRDQPTIEVVPVVHGEWIKKENTWVCSVCHKENACAYDETLHRFTDFYCPKCGAKMKGGTE